MDYIDEEFQELEVHALVFWKGQVPQDLFHKLPGDQVKVSSFKRKPGLRRDFFRLGAKAIHIKGHPRSAQKRLQHGGSHYLNSEGID